jgi:hypothetical protein
MACHNGQGPKGRQGSEYTTWATSDPHRRAFSVLRGERSERIIRNLAHQGWRTPAYKEGRCLGCHVSPHWEEVGAATPFALQDGVGCESCHGGAGRWLTEHYRSGWRQLPWAEKARLGMKDTKTVPGRVETCVGCHVGSPGLDVNHDLIAAGHPRLNFEFAAFHAILPHHWDDRKDRDPSFAARGRPDFEVRAWAVGQVKSAEAALELLAWRAETAAKDPKRQPWPEFAEYDCFACHHDLKAESWRRSREPSRTHPLGSLPWGEWYFSLTQQALTAFPRGRDKQVAEVVRSLRDKMETAAPQKEVVAPLATKAARRLRQDLEGWTQERTRLLPGAALFRAVLRAGGGGADATWDAATQRYLALAALHQAWTDMRAQVPPPPDGLGEGLRGVRSALRFTPSFESPRTFDLATFHRNLEQLNPLLSK